MIRLFHFAISHYNEKVRWALDRKRIPHARIALIPGFHTARVRLLSGQSQVPVLDLDGELLHDSSRILAALEARYPEPALFPAEPAARARALAIEDHFDEAVAPDLRRLFWSCYLDDPAACARMATHGHAAWKESAYRWLLPFARPVFRGNLGMRHVEAARARLSAHFDRLEAEIGASGYLVGDAFSVADLTAAAVMTAILRPPEFPYPLPEPWPDALVALRESVAHRAGFAWAMELYRRERDPSAEIRAA